LKWVAIIGAIDQEISNGRLYQEEWHTMHQKALSTIEEIKLNVPQVGYTMMDGGNKIKFLHQLIGKKRYINILDSMNS